MNTAESAIRPELPVCMLPLVGLRCPGEHSETTAGKVDRVAAALNINHAPWRDEERRDQAFEGMVGRSAALERALQELQVVAPTDCGVLILGATGTGKELNFPAIHDAKA